jgi:hypothetical protein
MYSFSLEYEDLRNSSIVSMHPLKLKDLQRSIACEQAMDAQPQDEDVGKLEQLESRQNLLEICPRGNNKVVIIISLGL